MTRNSVSKFHGYTSNRQMTASKVGLLDDPARFGKFWFKILLALFLLFYFFPQLDLGVARQFYVGDGKFSFSDMPSLIFIHENIDFVLWAGLAAIFVVGLSRLALKYATWQQTWRAMVYDHLGGDYWPWPDCQCAVQRCVGSSATFANF